MSEKVETVDVTLKLPKALVAFIKAIDNPESLETYLTNHTVETMQSYVEMLGSSPGVLMNRFHLKPVFKQYDVLPSYAEEAKATQEETEPSEKERLEMVNVSVDLYKPFYEFLKAYLAFFGSKQSIEDLCRSMIYKNTQVLYSQLKGFPFIEGQDWFSKWSHIAITEEPETEEDS